MNPMMKKMAAVLAATTLSVAAIPSAWTAVQAAAAANGTNTEVSISLLADSRIQEAVAELRKLGIMEGYEDHSMGETKAIVRSELAKLIYLAFALDQKTVKPVVLTDVSSDDWYAAYAAALVDLGIMQANNGAFDPQGTVTDAELVQMVSKAKQRDAKSIEHWMGTWFDAASSVSRGETAAVLQTAIQAIPSDQAKVTSVRALNAMTLIVTFDKPLTAEDEAFAKAKTDFAMNDGLTLTNMPRLKTGSIATYIVPTTVQKEGVTYTLSYKGQTAGTFVGNGTKVSMSTVRQVTQDTFEIEALKEQGVVDYGYIISAYSGGRGANAFVLDDREQADNKTYQIIPSMQAREVTITPEQGEPIVAKYVPFTQSTDGKQEPKFRLPEGQTLRPDVKYTVTTDWASIASPAFTAATIEPLQIAGAAVGDAGTVNITLSQDPGDELFSGRSVLLTAPNGDQLTAVYKYSSRKGATGVFELANNGKWNSGTTYTVTPVGDWAKADAVTVTTEA